MANVTPIRRLLKQRDADAFLNYTIATFPSVEFAILDATGNIYVGAGAWDGIAALFQKSSSDEPLVQANGIWLWRLEVGGW